MAAARKCAKCGTELPTGILAGRCPKCLGEVVFGITAGRPPPPSAEAPPPPQLAAPDSPRAASGRPLPVEPGVGRGEEQHAAAGVQPPASSPQKIRYFGDYELLKEIAHGGMGIVYKARQVSLDRLVAVKMILAGQLASEAEVKRFRAEAEAAASLDHPNIVAIYEVGEHQGQHYFSMRFVEGHSLAQLMKDATLKVEDGTRQPLPSSTLHSPTAVATLIATVARAVHYAHQRGILHRDLKPGNILIDAQGQPHVTDFGLAKRVDLESSLTVSGAAIGTPNYMPPEQAAGKARHLTTAADIYSLGAIVYELLTGQPPFEAETPMEVMRKVLEQEPKRPSSISRRVDRDLETICLKCLEKDPQRRYASADALAEDLERWRRGEPILARPGRTLDHVLKWARRNPAIASLILAVVVVAVTGFLGVAWQWRQAKANERIARAEAKKSEQVAKFLTDMLEGVGPSVALGRDTTMLKEILDKTADRVGKDLTNQPEVEADLRTTLGITYDELAEYAKAEAMCREALRLRRLRFGSQHYGVARALHNLATVLYHQNDLAGSETQLREALALERKLLGNEDLLVAGSINNLAMVVASRGDLAEAELLFRESLAIRKKLLGSHHQDVANSLDNLAVTLARRGDLINAESSLREVLEMKRTLLGREHPDVAASLCNLALVKARRGDLEGAEALQREHLAMTKRLFGEAHPEVADALNNLGNTLRHRGDLTGAEELHRKALEIRKTRFGEVHIAVAESLGSLAGVVYMRGDLAGAETLSRDALAIQRKLLGNEHPDVAETLQTLATVLYQKRDLTAAEAALTEALAIRKKVFGNEHADVANSMADLTSVLCDEGRPVEAEALARECLAIREKKLPDDWQTFDTRSALGGSLLAQKKDAEAEPLLLSGYEGLKQRREKIPAEHKPRLKQALERLVQLYEGTDRPEQAAEWKKQLGEVNEAETLKKTTNP